MKNKNVFNKKLCMFLVFFVAVTASMFAADAANEVNDIVGNLVNFFSNGWVKGIACIALIAEAIGLIFAGGQNPQVFKKFLPLIAGTIIFMCAGKIITLIFGSDPDFAADLEKTSMVVPIEHTYTDMC